MYRKIMYIGTRLAAIASLVTAVGISGASASSGGQLVPKSPSSRTLQVHAETSACRSETVVVQEHRLDGSIVPGITFPATITTCPRATKITPDGATIQGYWSINCGYGSGAHLTYYASNLNIPTGFSGFVRFYNTYIYGGNGYGDVNTATGTYNQTIRVSVGGSRYLAFTPKAELYSNDYRVGYVNGGGCGT